MTPEEKLWLTHTRLQELYGEVPLKPRREPMHELISTMISPRTTNANEDKAYFQMREHFGSWENIMNADMAELADALAPARFPGQKAVRIKKTLKAIKEQRGEFNIDFLKDLPTDEGMEWLMSLPGVGVKVASLVLLFCFFKPVLPVDTHVLRISQRVGFLPHKASAAAAHDLLLAMLPQKSKVIFNFHIHMLWHGQRVCLKRGPKHDLCPLTDICDYCLEGEGKVKSKTRKKAKSKKA